jgi:hypothetical protein
MSETFAQIIGLLFFIILAVFMLKKSFEEEEKIRNKLNEETLHFEAEKLSKKLRDSRVEMGVRKPQSFKTKRKLQKPLDKGKK